MKDSKRRSTAKDVFHVSSSDSDDDLVKPLIRSKLTAEAAKLAVMSTDIKEMKESVLKIFRLTNGMSIPLGLRQLLYDTFKCSICQSTPMVPPVIFAKCCKTVLGCQQCVNTWYRGRRGSPGPAKVSKWSCVCGNMQGKRAQRLPHWHYTPFGRCPSCRWWRGWREDSGLGLNSMMHCKASLKTQ